jgi:hypothetical protein
MTPKRPVTCTNLVGDTGIEPVTSSVSGKRATAAPIARAVHNNPCEVETGFEPVWTALQAAASPLGHSTMRSVHPTGSAEPARRRSTERMTGFEPATLTLAR